MTKSRLQNTYEKIPHRLDGLNVHDHYMTVIRRIGKYTRRLIRAGFVLDAKNDVFKCGTNHVTLEYIENICDFTSDEFKSKYGGW